MENFEAFMKLNDEFVADFNNNICFDLMRKGSFNESHVGRFLACYQEFSDAFQKALFVRAAFSDDPAVIPAFKQHFNEEIGHNDLLFNDRKSLGLTEGKGKKDAILTALTTWMVYKVQSGNHYEQAVLMNICIETAAPVIYTNSKPVLDPSNKLTHFKAHEGDIDCGHVALGSSLLKGLTATQYKRLNETLRESWAMLNALMRRMAELTLEKDLASF